MAFRKITEFWYLASNSDVKEIDGVPIGAQLRETDTDTWYTYDGANWIEHDNVTMDYRAKRIRMGVLWCITQLTENVGNNVALEVTLEMPDVNTDCIWAVASGGDAHLRVFEGITFTGGSDTCIRNAHRVIGDAGAPASKTDITVTDEGTEIFQSMVPGGSGGNAGGGQGSRGNEFILKADTEYLFRLTNKAGQAKDMSIFLNCHAS